MFEIAVPVHVLLAMSCVAEIGFHKDTTECEIMWEVNARNAELRNRTLRKQTLLYNAYWRSTPQRSKRPWIQHLRGVEEPKHWPQNLKWGVHKRMWLRYLRAAKTFVSEHKKRKPLCPLALDYGAPKEYPPPYMRRIVCSSNTLQWYWAKKDSNEIQKRKRGILPKSALSRTDAVSESILSKKKRSAEHRGASE